MTFEHGLWLQSGRNYVLEAYAETGTTADSEHTELNSRTAAFSLSATIDQSDSSDRYFLKDYLPLADGLVWNYLQTYADGHKDYEVLCIGGSEPINGATAYKRWQFDSGELDSYDYSYESLAWTQEGLKLYKLVCSDGPYLTYDPPAIQFPASIRTGETFRHSCTITKYDSSGHIVDSWPYSIELTLEGIEDVKVLAGNFARCLKLSGKEVDEGQEAEIIYRLAPGIGEVKRVFPNNEERELIYFTGRGKIFYPAN
jgi:hypothetical protein